MRVFLSKFQVNFLCGREPLISEKKSHQLTASKQRCRGIRPYFPALYLGTSKSYPPCHRSSDPVSWWVTPAPGCRKRSANQDPNRGDPGLLPTAPGVPPPLRCPPRTSGSTASGPSPRGRRGSGGLVGGSLQCAEPPTRKINWTELEWNPIH